VGGGLGYLRYRAPVVAMVPPAPALADRVDRADRVLRFADGSTATPLSADSELVPNVGAPTVPGRMTVAVRHGGARFAVSKNPARVFRVETGGVAVEVLGTQFTVERVEARVRVAVEEGRVRVLWEGGRAELGVGEAGVFPPLMVDEPAPPVRKPAAPATRAPKPTSWKDWAQDGDYDKAYEVMVAAAPAISDEPAELLLAADVKRLSHHPREAVAPLRKLVANHGGDPRAPLAAFTLGRVLLEELGQPREAAEAFARASALAPTGVLAEDARAREVEAWSRAGDGTRARLGAEEYVRRYPDGRKLRSVRRFGGLDGAP